MENEKENQQELTKQPETEATETQIETQSKETVDPEVLKAQVREQVKKEAEEEAFRKYQGIQRTLRERDKRIKELERLANSTPLEDDFAIQALIRDKKSRQAQIGEPDHDIAVLEAEIARRKADQQRRIQIEQQEKIVASEREKIEQRITEAKLNPEDEVFDAVWDAFDYARDVNGDFTKANKRLERILGKSKTDDKQPPKVEEKPKVDPKLLKVDTGRPGGASSTDSIPLKKDEFRSWVAGLSLKEYEKLAPKIKELIDSGKIK